ncbi:hypothetical protein MRX96_053675 [Rhipicephalus microplus]
MGRTLFQRPREADAEWERRVGLHMASGAAIDVALAVLRTEASFDEQRLPDVSLSGRQLFYVMLCYMQCGGATRRGAVQRAP